MEKKRCGKCDRKKFVKEFSRKGKGRNSCCRECQQKYWKRWYSNPRSRAEHIRQSVIHNQERRQRFQRIADEEKRRPCADCGKSYSSWVMHFDHLPENGTKLGNVSFFAHGNSTEKALRAEMKKCEVVCANCHAERTHQRAVGGNRVSPALQAGIGGGGSRTVHQS